MNLVLVLIDPWVTLPTAEVRPDDEPNEGHTTFDNGESIGGFAPIVAASTLEGRMKQASISKTRSNLSVTWSTSPLKASICFCMFSMVPLKCLESGISVGNETVDVNG